jgi:hypothetical protein
MVFCFEEPRGPGFIPATGRVTRADAYQMTAALDPSRDGPDNATRFKEPLFVFFMSHAATAGLEHPFAAEPLPKFRSDSVSFLDLAESSTLSRCWLEQSGEADLESSSIVADEECGNGRVSFLPV